MLRYTGNISLLSQHIIAHYSAGFDAAIDATLGNGYDTDFLSSHFKMVYAFDIQETAILNYYKKKKENVQLFHASHEDLTLYVRDKVNCVIYNLGYLPGGDKSITTQYMSTMRSLQSALDILAPQGLIAIAMYEGHEEGKKEKGAIIELLKKLPKEKYGVILHSFLNRENNPPSLVVIESKY